MLGDNIRKIRKSKGYTQEELAIRLHVVRQTVSKWEKNLSVPDVETLQNLSDILETPITVFLGADMAEETKQNEIAEQLSRINEQLAVKNRRAKRIWVTIGLLAAVMLIGIVFSFVMYRYGGTSTSYSMEMSLEEPVYSEREVEEAFQSVEKYFKENYKHCRLESLRYDEEEPGMRNKKWEDKYAPREIMVIESEFVTDAKGAGGTLKPNFRVQNWKWLLVKEPSGNWTVQEEGFF